jgi:hypothetical protein
VLDSTANGFGTPIDRFGVDAYFHELSPPSFPDQATNRAFLAPLSTAQWLAIHRSLAQDERQAKGQTLFRKRLAMSDLDRCALASRMISRFNMKSLAPL